MNFLLICFILPKMVSFSNFFRSKPNNNKGESVKDFSGFYFIEGNIRNLHNLASINIQPSEILNPTLACLFLNHSQYLHLTKLSSSYLLRPLTPDQKLIAKIDNNKFLSSGSKLLEDSTEYLIKAHSSYQPMLFERSIYPNYYISSHPNLSNPLIQFAQPLQSAVLLHL